MPSEVPHKRRWFPWALASIAMGCVLAFVLLQSDSESSRRSDSESPRAPRPLSPHERKAKRLEVRLEARPGDRELQRRAIETWTEAASQRLINGGLSETLIPRSVREDYEAAVRIWRRYLKQTGGGAGADIAETAAHISMALAEIGSRDLDLLDDYVAGSAQAVQIAGRLRPTLYTLSNVAVYSYFNGEFARGDVAAKGAAADADSKRLHRIAVEQLEGYRERGEAFRGLLERAKAELDESGDELLDKPLRAYVHRVGLNKDDPAE